jgi:hypothetical protein
VSMYAALVVLDVMNINVISMVMSWKVQ